jgi:hypothetical protein
MSNGERRFTWQVYGGYADNNRNPFGHKELKSVTKSDLSIDHVIYCVRDLDQAAGWFLRKHGLRSVAGGRHAGLGTANRIIPLGDNYIELLTVIDRRAARSNPFGIWATVAIDERSMLPVGLCMRTEDLQSVAKRLNLTPTAMSRPTPDGVELRWQSAGLELTLTRDRPFFIQWDIDMADHPGRSLEGQGPIESVVLSGRVDELRGWLDAVDGPVSIVEGPPGITGLTIAHPSGVIELGY